MDREIFTLKIICVDKFSQFVQSTNFFLTVDSYIMDEHLERSYCLVYYLVIDQTFTSGGVDVSAHAYLLIITA